MALHGSTEDFVPFQGCTSFATDLTLGRIPGHMALTLAEMVRAVKYRNLKPKCIEIASRSLQGDYIKSTGEYVGAGMKVFVVYFDSEIEYYSHTIRATSRQELRKALKLLYPTSNVSR